MRPPHFAWCGQKQGRRTKVMSAIKQQFEKGGQLMCYAVGAHSNDDCSTASFEKGDTVSRKKCKAEGRKQKQKNKKIIMRILESGSLTPDEFCQVRAEAADKDIDVGPPCAMIPLPRFAS